MTGVPIDEAAFGKAFRAAHPTRSSTGVSEQRLRRGISAYLEAIGATVEYGLAYTDGSSRVHGGLDHSGADMMRVTFSWKPLTDTEEER